MATKIISTTIFFLQRNYFCGTKISINFVNVCSKPTLSILFKFNTGFFSCCSLTRLVNMGKSVSALVCFIIFTCLYFNVDWLTQPAILPRIQEWNTKKRSRDTRAVSMFFNVLMSTSLFQCLFQITHLVLEFLLLTLSR